MFRLFVLNKNTHTLPRLPAGLGPSLVFALGLPTTRPLCRLDSTAGSSGGSLDHQLQVGPAPRPGLSSFLTVITTRTGLAPAFLVCPFCPDPRAEGRDRSACSQLLPRAKGTVWRKGGAPQTKMGMGSGWICERHPCGRRAAAESPLLNTSWGDPGGVCIILSHRGWAVRPQLSEDSGEALRGSWWADTALCSRARRDTRAIGRSLLGASHGSPCSLHAELRLREVRSLALQDPLISSSALVCEIGVPTSNH